MFNFQPHPKSVCALFWGKQNQQNIAFLLNAVIYLNLKDVQKHILIIFLTLWLTFHPTVSFFNYLQKNCLKYGRTMRR